MAVSADGRVTVAIIGAGEMGSAVGRRLRGMGARVITELKGRSEQSTRRVADAGLEVIDDDQLLVDEANFILSIVPPGVACAVAERFRAPLSRTGRKPMFVECNAIAPKTVRRIEATLDETGCGFIDAGIIGGPPPLDDLVKGPRFYASGPHAQMFASMAQYGLDIALLEAPVGAASALKLAYAGMTKGFTALGAAMIGAAAREHLADALLAELARTQPDMLARLERFIPAMFPKAYRWVAEMEQIADFAGEEGKGAAIYQGAARLYERIAAEFEGNTAGEWLSALTGFCKQRK
ncbi:MAG: NAD(P)-dependent oxidoreductase [Deltaproteobacteria bacterium]|nr:NAD(P)-dependent oxidoreductase [Deltaproteobacteria bacterium]